MKIFIIIQTVLLLVFDLIALIIIPDFFMAGDGVFILGFIDTIIGSIQVIGALILIFNKKYRRLILLKYFILVIIIVLLLVYLDFGKHYISFGSIQEILEPYFKNIFWSIMFLSLVIANFYLYLLYKMNQKNAKTT